MESGQTLWGLQEIHPKHKDSESPRDPKSEAGVSEAADPSEMTLSPDLSPPCVPFVASAAVVP